MYEFFIENMEVYEINCFLNSFRSFEIKCQCFNDSKIVYLVSDAICGNILNEEE